MTIKNGLKKICEIARIYSLSAATIYSAIKRGRIKPTIIDKQYFLTLKVFDKYISSKYCRTQSLFDHKPLYSNDEISPTQAFTLCNTTQTNFYYMLKHGVIPSYRKGCAYIIKKSGLQFYLKKINDCFSLAFFFILSDI